MIDIHWYGRPPFDPALVLKMALVAYLYNLSERQVEVYVSENLPAKYFVGLAADQKARVKGGAIQMLVTEVWLHLKATPEYQAGVQERYKIERKFGEAKQSHGLGRCRYIGTVRFAIQAILTAMALNLKRLVKILTGVEYKKSATASASLPREEWRRLKKNQKMRWQKVVRLSNK